MRGGPANQEQPLSPTAVGHRPGRDRVQNPAGRHHIRPGGDSIMHRHKAEVVQPRRQRGLHQRDEFAAAGPPGGEGGKVGRPTTGQDEVGRG